MNDDVHQDDDNDDDVTDDSGDESASGNSNDSNDDYIDWVDDDGHNVNDDCGRYAIYCYDMSPSLIFVCFADKWMCLAIQSCWSIKTIKWEEKLHQGNLHEIDSWHHLHGNNTANVIQCFLVWAFC